MNTESKDNKPAMSNTGAAKKYTAEIWGADNPDDFIQTRKGKRTFDDFLAGAKWASSQTEDVEALKGEVERLKGLIMSMYNTFVAMKDASPTVIENNKQFFKKKYNL